MKLESSPMLPLDDSTQTPEERARCLCQLARAFEEVGDYEQAEAVLREFWKGVGTEPLLNGLSENLAAEVLVRAGVITRRISRSDVTGNVHESAKNLISRGLQLYEQLNLPEKVAEAQSELAYCYWRQGEYDNARDLLVMAIPEFLDSDLKAEASLRLAVVEKCAGRVREALSILSGAAALFEQSNSHALKGRFHLEKATFLKNLGEAEGSHDFVDRALIEYAAAGYHFTEAGHERNLGLVENQVGFLLLKKKEFEEAHAHLKRARQTFLRLKDFFRAAQVEETRAQVFLEEERFREAEQAASFAVDVLERGDARALLAEALTTCGKAQARGGDNKQARATLRRALEVARHTGDAMLIVTTIVTTINESVSHMGVEELIGLYIEADELLSHEGGQDIVAQLHACANSIIKVVKKRGAGPDSVGRIGETVSATFSNLSHRVDWKGFSISETIQKIEEACIRRALKDAEGSVSRAALLLGLKHPESLNSKINKLGLHNERTPPRPRKRSIISKEFEGRKRRGS